MRFFEFTFWRPFGVASARSRRFSYAVLIVMFLASWYATGLLLPIIHHLPFVRADGITRVQTATAATGTSASSSLSVTLPSAPQDGNALVAVIADNPTIGTSAVSSVSQTGASWSQAEEIGGVASSNTQGVEIWYATNISGASASITVHYSSSNVFGTVLVGEYSGIATTGALDQTANNNGSSSSTDTGTTSTTTQDNELWIGGISNVNDSTTQSSPTNGFTLVNQTASGSSSHGNNTDTTYNEKIVSSAGTANTGTSLSRSRKWSGVIATFEATAAPSSTLTQSSYRWFANTDSTDVGSPLSSTNSPATLSSTGGAARLRQNVQVATNPLLTGHDFNLQIAGKGGGSCSEDASRSRSQRASGAGNYPERVTTSR